VDFGAVFFFYGYFFNGEILYCSYGSDPVHEVSIPPEGEADSYLFGLGRSYL
jgi:hypothetical protein